MGRGLGGLLGLAIGVAVVDEVLHHSHLLHRTRRKLRRKSKKRYY